MLVARNLTKTYLSGGRPLVVLKEVSLAVDAGGFLAIVGPSGCGKTTLLGLLAGLDRPTSGSVSLDGADLSALSEDGRARLRGEKIGQAIPIPDGKLIFSLPAYAPASFLLQ